MPQFKLAGPGDRLPSLHSTYETLGELCLFLFCKIGLILYLTHWEFVRNNLKIFKKQLALCLVSEPLLSSSSSSSISTNVQLYNNLVLVLFPQNLNDC